MINNTKDKLRIIFVGIPDMAIITLSNLVEQSNKKNFNIVGVVPPKKDHETYDYFKDFILSKGLNFLTFEKSPNEPELIEKIKKLNADVGVVSSYNTLLSKEFLNTTRLGYINCHPSLLPQYRGAAPYFHVINNGEKKSGITLHFMDEKFDTGDIIYQKEFELTPFETMGTIFNRTNFMLSDALIETLEKIQKGEKINRIKQPDNKDFITAPKVDGNFRLRWTLKSACEIERLIRACNPFFNVYTTFRGVSFKIIKARLVELKNSNNDNQPIFEAGKIMRADRNCLIVAAKDGLLSLDVFQVGTWGVLNPEDFYFNFSPRVDEYLI